MKSLKLLFDNDFKTSYFAEFAVIHSIIAITAEVANHGIKQNWLKMVN